VLCPARMWLWLLRSLAWAVLSPAAASGLSPQERALLRSLGLSHKPSPKSPAPVPPVLWRIFHKRRTLPWPQAELESCRVEELNVPGNIVRVFADQGTATPRLGSPGSSLGSAPSFLVSRGRSWIPGEIPAGWSP
ncbi:GDF3 factor, partial [Loxia curvirostra]|nr:GDF3 factor [Loxia curvirostra]NXH00867.1 GDF3 factor [Loxia leucoptera]